MRGREELLAQQNSVVIINHSWLIGSLWTANIFENSYFDDFPSDKENLANSFHTVSRCSRTHSTQPFDKLKASLRAAELRR